MLYNIVEELPRGDMLHDEEDVGGGLKHLVQLDDVRVPKEAQDLDLPQDLLLHVQCPDLRPVQNLDRDAAARGDVLSGLDL